MSRSSATYLGLVTVEWMLLAGLFVSQVSRQDLVDLLTCAWGY